MQRWQLTAGLSILAALGALLAPRLLASLPTVPEPPEPAPLPEPATGPLTLTERLDQTALPAGQATERYVVVEVTAPADDSGTRRPVHLAIVLDTSGSMAGRDKMDNARTAAHELVDQLHPEDSFALVGFSDTPRVYIAGASADGGKAEWNRVIDGVSPSGGTNLYAGLETGIDELTALSGDAIDRVVVLSDGMANIGVTDPASLRALAASHASTGITVSTVGLGLDFNEDLLAAMSDAGGGTYAFVDRPGELSQILDGELTAMTTLAARNAKLDVGMAPGVEVLETYAENTETRNGGFTIFLGDVHAGEHRKIVARVRIPAGSEGTQAVSSAHLGYVASEGGVPLVADASCSALVTADLVRVDASVDRSASQPVLSAVSGARMHAAAHLYGEGRADEGRKALDDGRSALETLGRRYATPDAAPLISELGDKAAAFGQASQGSDAGLYLVKKTKEEARELSNR